MEAIQAPMTEYEARMQYKSYIMSNSVFAGGREGVQYFQSFQDWYGKMNQSAGGGNNTNQNFQQNLETAGEVANYTDLTNSVWGSGLAAIGKNWNQTIKVGGYGIAAGSLGIQMLQTVSNPQGVSYRDGTELVIQAGITLVSFINLYGALIGIPAAILLQGLNYEYGYNLYNRIPDTKYQLK